MAELELRRRLQRRARKPVVLIVTDNRYSMLHVRPAPRGAVTVRLHRMFLDAPQPVVGALAQFIRRPTPQCHRALNDWIRANEARIARQPRRQEETRLQHRGYHHDLRRIYDRLNERYFEGRLRVPITWGRGRAGRRRYSIDFGSFDARSRIIRINPALDRQFVPGFFVSYIVYHEMLHAALGYRSAPNGRRLLHSPRFLKEERQYRRYRSALRWEDANLWRFLRAG